MDNSIITPDFIEGILKETHFFKDVSLASKPQIIKASPKSNMAVVWVNIWDSQSGSSAKNIINCYFNIGRFIATIHSTNMNPAISQCKNCWTPDMLSAMELMSLNITERKYDVVWRIRKQIEWLPKKESLVLMSSSA